MNSPYMTFGTEEDLAKQIKTQLRMAYISACAVLFAAISFILSIVSLIVKEYAALFFCVALLVIFAVILILIARIHKKEEESSRGPYKIRLSHEVSFEELKRVLRSLTGVDECRDFPDKSAYFCFLTMTYEYRFLAVNTGCFDKSDFDTVKKSINKTINKEHAISPWIPRDKAVKMMRINLIVTDEVNEALYEYVSRNAGVTLRRLEGVISFAVVKDRLIVPPLFGDNDVLEVNRYNKSIADVKELVDIVFKND